MKLLIALTLILAVGCVQTAEPTPAARVAEATPLIVYVTPEPTATPTPTPEATVDPDACVIGLSGTGVVEYTNISRADCTTIQAGKRPLVPRPTTTPICSGTQYGTDTGYFVWASDPLDEAAARASLCTLGDKPVGKAVTIKGTQTHGNTKKFDLQRGDYTVTVSGKAKSSKSYGYEFGGGNVITTLYCDGEWVEQLSNEIVKGGRKYNFATNLYDLNGGKCYIDLLMPKGSWAVAFTPQ